MTETRVRPGKGATGMPGHLLVTPNGPADGGDFGPETSRTRTSGIQEALACAKEMEKDVYIAGGGLREAFKGGVRYTLEETLRIPWNQNWRLDGGEYWLSYTGDKGDAVVIDSQMNCRIKMGLIVNASSPDAVVRLCPSTRGPDDFSCIVASTFEFNGMVGAGDVWGREGSIQKSTGLLMDAGSGGINANSVRIAEINACDVGIHLMQGCHANRLEATWIHLTNLGIRIGDEDAPNVTGNVIQAGVSGDLPGTSGIQIFGQRNLITLSARANDPGKNIILERPARDNTIIGLDLPEGVTNRADVPTNRIVTPAVGFSIETPPLPASGQITVNREPYTIQVLIVDSGAVSEWTLRDSAGRSQRFDGGLSTGQTFVLGPGDAISLSYREPPKWRWKAL